MIIGLLLDDDENEESTEDDVKSSGADNASGNQFGEPRRGYRGKSGVSTN